MDFRTKLVQTLRALEPIFKEDVMVIGSEVPNLLDGARTVVIVSQDIDIGVPVSSHGRVRSRLREIGGFRAAPEEPSVLLPQPGRGDLIEVNFIGIDPALRDISDSYVLDDPELPLLVLGSLSLLKPGGWIAIEGVDVPIPEPASLLVEKLLTERSGVKGDRDLLVALALLISPSAVSQEQLRAAVAGLKGEDRACVQANLTVLSLMQGVPDMPDPTRFRAKVLWALEMVEEAAA